MSGNIKIKKRDIWKYSTFAIIGLFFVIAGFVVRNREMPADSVIFGGSKEIIEVKTTIKNFKYNPDVITVKEGSRVRLTIENKDNVVHGLHLPQFGIIESQPPLGTKTVEFIAVENPANGQAVPTCIQEHGEELTFNIV